MGSSPLIRVILLALLAATVHSPKFAFAEWVFQVGDDGLLLSRVDNSSHVPYHELEAGTYAFQDSLSLWVTVLDFSTTLDIVSPFTWTQVYWEPGPLDWYVSNTLTPIDEWQPDLERLLEGIDQEIATMGDSPVQGFGEVAHIQISVGNRLVWATKPATHTGHRLARPESRRRFG